MSNRNLYRQCRFALSSNWVLPFTDGPIGPLSYRHSSGVVRNPHSALAE